MSSHPRCGTGRAFGGAAAFLLALAAVACGKPSPEASAPPAPVAQRPSILLVTLDTTRADFVAPEAPADATPNLARLAAAGRSFRHAYATAPMTLPAHASLLTGLYPAAHGVHENGRALAGSHPVLAERLREAGYGTAAFVSSWVLDRQFGLARGFDHYDDGLPADAAERPAAATTDRALAWLAAAPERPLFAWVHYFDPHAPYEPPEPYRARFPDDPYRGEIAYLDAELGRLLAAFAARAGAGGHRVVVVGDHGEGLGEHGEGQHGKLLYQGVMRVPLVLAGDDVPAGSVEEPVSARRVYDTALAWAGLDGPRSLLAAAPEPVLGEAMQPYLSYGWQPQLMAVGGRWKAIRAGRLEVYDLAADPAESRDLGGQVEVSRPLLAALRDYPLPGSGGDTSVDEETRRRLASLGYTASTGPPRLRPNAPRPRDMAHLFADLDHAAGLFAAGRYGDAAPLLAALAERDPENLMVAVQTAVSHSLLGQETAARRWFDRARGIDPGSVELQHYEGLHHCRREDWAAADPLLTATVARDPQRLNALECLARAREAQGRPAEAASLLERVAARKREPQRELARAGELRMLAGDTAGAIAAFERAHGLAGGAFAHHLELGVLYLASRRYAESRASLDRVTAEHPDYPLALFKRAQVSVLLGEPDARQHVQRAAAAADDVTGPLIARERLFEGLR